MVGKTQVATPDFLLISLKKTGKMKGDYYEKMYLSVSFSCHAL